MQGKLSAGAEDFIRAVTDFIFVEDEPQQADVILVPGSRKIDNALRAAELYRVGYAPWVLPSGKYGVTLGQFVPLDEPLRSQYPGDFESEWELHRAVLMQNGVPESAILREDQATYTWENAQRSRDVLKGVGIQARTAILCCKAFHARRAQMYYQAAMPDTRILVCPVQTPGCSREDWFLTEKGRQRVLGEVARLGSQVNEVFTMMMEQKPGENR